MYGWVLHILLVALPLVQEVCFLPDMRQTEVWVEGRSTVESFRCRSGEAEGLAWVEGTRLHARARIPVAAFDCGKEAMNRDLQTTLRAGEHPYITFILDTLVRVDTTAGNALVGGRLTLAGAERRVKLEVRITPGEDALNVEGGLPIRLPDFGVEPPSRLLGLIRVHDVVYVGFTVRIRPLPGDSCAAYVFQQTTTPTKHGG